MENKELAIFGDGDGTDSYDILRIWPLLPTSQSNLGLRHVVGLARSYALHLLVSTRGTRSGGRHRSNARRRSEEPIERIFTED
jgi:hypothetical protein